MAALMSGTETEWKIAPYMFLEAVCCGHCTTTSSSRAQAESRRHAASSAEDEHRGSSEDAPARVFSGVAHDSRATCLAGGVVWSGDSSAGCRTGAWQEYCWHEQRLSSPHTDMS
eukprot:scaffold63946_cov61-Phaeocystis_antarctica.AAC.3